MNKQIPLELSPYYSMMKNKEMEKAGLLKLLEETPSNAGQDSITKRIALCDDMINQSKEKLKDYL